MQKSRSREWKKAYVALDIGSTGKLLKPMGILDFEEAVGVFAEHHPSGRKAGADLILIETMSDTYELKAAVLAAKRIPHCRSWQRSSLTKAKRC